MVAVGTCIVIMCIGTCCYFYMKKDNNKTRNKDGRFGDDTSAADGSPNKIDHIHYE